MGLLDRGVEIKTPEQIDLMRKAGLVVGRTLELLRANVRPGDHDRASSTRSPRTASAPPARRRRSWATTASRPPSARR